MKVKCTKIGVCSAELKEFEKNMQVLLGDNVASDCLHGEEHEEVESCKTCVCPFMNIKVECKPVDKEWVTDAEEKGQQKGTTER